MKCRKCGGRAVLELRRHNTAFCGPDFQEFFQHHVLETVRRWRMFTRDETVLVAVSGGKDSLALWDVLHGAGYRTTGLYIDLGIFDYSHASKARCQAFAAERGLAPQVLSRAVEDSGTVTSVLVPWNTCGAYISGVLGVPTGSYLPFCFFNYLSPVLDVLFGFIGFKVPTIAEVEASQGFAASGGPTTDAAPRGGGGSDE